MTLGFSAISTLPISSLPTTIVVAPVADGGGVGWFYDLRRYFTSIPIQIARNDPWAFLRKPEKKRIEEEIKPVQLVTIEDILTGQVIIDEYVVTIDDVLTGKFQLSYQSNEIKIEDIPLLAIDSQVMIEVKHE